MVSCGNPQFEAEALMPRRLPAKQKGICVKCKENQGRVIIRHAAYCKDCFFTNFSHKSRKCLEPYVNEIPDGPRRTALKATGNLCVGFSGGLGSTVLLDFISRTYSPSREHDVKKGGKDHPRNAAVWPKAFAVYIECSNAFEGMQDRTADVRSNADMHNFFEFKTLRLEDAFDPQWWKSIGRTAEKSLIVDISNEDLRISLNDDETQDPVTRLRTYLSSLPTQTAVLSAIQTLVRILLIHAADSLGCSHLLLGTSLTSLSIALISSISQGGGFTVREEAQEEWQPPTLNSRALRILRPLRDVGMKECAMWAWWRGLVIVGKEKLPGGKNGVGFLTKDFIVGLERDYPSTVSTIVKTCAKLAPKATVTSCCVLCQRPAQGNVQEWKSRISIRSFSSQNLPSHVSDELPDLFINTEQDTPSLTPSLCYACHTTLTSRSSRGSHSRGPKQETLSTLTPPVWVTAEAWRMKNLDQDAKREQIADFLL